jgi:MFS family permease
MLTSLAGAVTRRSATLSRHRACHTMNKDRASHGPLAPFSSTSFAVMWAATLAATTGTWMHDVGAGWLMTELSGDPRRVALVQTFTMLPGLLFVLPAGALADIFDRRRLLIIVRTAMGVVAATLGLVVFTGHITPWGLLAFTFVLGAGNALTAPVWQSIVPQLVPRPVLAQAIALNSMAVNISRAIGPVVAGVLIATVSVAAPFLLNAVAFTAMVAAVAWWRPPPRPASPLPNEDLVSAMRAGLRYARASTPVKATLGRVLIFVVFASAYWALLPLIARDLLGGGPTLYGLLVGAIGAGAVIGAFVLPALRTRLGADRLVGAATVGTSLALAGFAIAPNALVAMAASLIAGLCWISSLSSMNVSMQMALPEWVRGRGLSIYHMSFFGSMALGSYSWGQAAHWLGIPNALYIAAAGALVGLPLARRWRLLLGLDLDLSPSVRWPQPVPAWRFPPDRGPAFTTVEYTIKPQRREAFFALLGELENCRRRGGAVAWGIYEDVASPGRFVETFLDVSWLQHLRHHERVTAADRAILDAVVACHAGPERPRVTHLVRPASSDLVIPPTAPNLNPD